MYRKNFFYKNTKEETWNFERLTDEHTVKKWCKKLQVWNYKIGLNN